MKTIKIKFVGVYDGFAPEQSLIVDILKKHYNVEITDDADYIFCSVFGRPYQFCEYQQIRIMFSYENYIPDLNLVDYAICPYPMSFLDRCVYKPVCFDDLGHFVSLQDKDRNYSKSILAEKNYFANFIASHESEFGIRGTFFRKLCEYKRVESLGKYLNNMDEPITVSHGDNSKTDFQRKCKFTLCFESTKHEGFVTEKITDAFFADTIPIYYGSSTVKDIFNSKAFINCSDYPDFDAVIAHIIELDQNDDKYMEMLRQPIFNQPDLPKRLFANLEDFLLSIFEQPIETSYRRSKVYWPSNYENYVSSESPSVFYKVSHLQGQISKLENEQKYMNRKSDELDKLRKELRGIVKDNKSLYPFEKNLYLYQLAFPKLMDTYWILQGVKYRIKKLWSRICHK